MSRDLSRLLGPEGARRDRREMRLVLTVGVLAVLMLAAGLALLAAGGPS
jgi:hypothetical protein